MQIFLSRALLFFPLFCGQPKHDYREISSSPKIGHFEMVSIKGGTFLMGGLDIVANGGPRETELLHGDECPHAVTVKDFYIGRYEVTQAEWNEIMEDNPSNFKDDDKNPVEQVSWEDVQIFISRLNSKYSEHFRLPTEQEWEFAARGGLRSKNFRYAGSNNANEVAWWAGNSDARPHAVGTLA
jgi:formylglycine-generating enzyme required for sulfatase activity